MISAPSNTCEAPIRPVPWDQEEVRRFIAQARGDRLFALYLLILVTGMRRGETLGLRWQDVDLDAGGLRVVQQLVELRGQLIVGKPKTRSGSRTVPLDPTTVELLRAQRAVQETEREQWGDA